MSWRIIDPNTNTWLLRHFLSSITLSSLLQDILPHLGTETDICMSIITENLMTCLGSQSVILRKTTVHILQIYLRFSSDVQAVIRLEFMCAINILFAIYGCVCRTMYKRFL